MNIFHLVTIRPALNFGLLDRDEGLRYRVRTRVDVRLLDIRGREARMIAEEGGAGSRKGGSLSGERDRDGADDQGGATHYVVLDEGEGW